MNYRLLSISIIALIFALACSEEEDRSNMDQAQLGALVYKQYCKTCHGAKGKLGLSGAKDLSQSELTLEERKYIIVHGKNTMTPFKKILSDKEIDAVAKYTQKLSEGDE
jgi:cytochrome c6